MLSLEECRAILGTDAPVDESELAEQREEVYRLARLLLEIFFSTAAPKLQPDPVRDSESQTQG